MAVLKKHSWRYRILPARQAGISPNWKEEEQAKRLDGSFCQIRWCNSRPALRLVCTTSFISVVDGPVESADVERVTLVPARSEPSPATREEGV